MTSPVFDISERLGAGQAQVVRPVTPAVSLRGVSRAYGENVVLREIDLEVAPGEFLVVVGPSGSGKSTLLRLIAGLDDVSGGEVWLDGVLANDLEARERDIAMVFQAYALYPHLTVFKNLAMSLELRRLPREEIGRRVEEAAELLDIAYLLNRKPRLLSGGQRQRVALARALVRDPMLFLLDEPLSSLDAQVRREIRGEIGKLHRRLGAAFVYVTHDPDEALTLADRIVVLDDGVIQQVGTPAELCERPANSTVAALFGGARAVRHVVAGAAA